MNRTASAWVFGLVHVPGDDRDRRLSHESCRRPVGMMVRLIFSVIIGTVLLSSWSILAADTLWYLRDGVLEMAWSCLCFVWHIEKSVFLPDSGG